MPATKAPSIFADGWSEEKKKKLDETKLPAKLRCKECKKLKAILQYSQRQLGTVKQALARNPHLNENGLAIITCRQCTEGQVMELECSECGQIKALEGFTKVQRRDPDFACCIDCVNIHQTEVVAADQVAEVGEHAEHSDEEDEQEDDDDEYDLSDGGSNPFKSDDEDDESVSGSQAQAGTKVPASAYKGSKKAGSQWGNYAKENGRENANIHYGKDEAPATYTGYDPSGKAHSRIHAPSTVAAGSHTVAPRSNFARVKAYKPSPKTEESSAPTEQRIIRNDGTMAVPAAAKEAIGRQRESHDSDSDSEFGVM